MKRQAVLAELRAQQETAKEGAADAREHALEGKMNEALRYAEQTGVVRGLGIAIGLLTTD